MKAVFKLENTDQILASATITLPVGDWKRFKSQLDESKDWNFYPMSDFRDLMTQIIAEATVRLEKNSELK